MFSCSNPADAGRRRRGGRQRAPPGRTRCGGDIGAVSPDGRHGALARVQTMMRVQAHARARLTGIHACAYRASPGAGGGAPRRCPSAHWGSAAAVAPPCARWRTSAPAARLPAAKGPPAAQQARRGAPQRRGPGPWHTPPGARPASAAPRAAAWSLRNGGRYRVRAAVSGGP